MADNGALEHLVLAQGVDTTQEAALAALLAEITSADAPLPAPIASKALLLGDPALAGVKQALRAPSGTFAVQESQSFLGCQTAQIGAGQNVAVHEQRSESGASFRFGLNDTGAQMETRLKFLTAPQIREMTPPSFSARMAPETAQITALVALNEDIVARYLALAHDDNPIHTDDVIAKVAGFAGAIVPGMLLCAVAEALCRQSNTALVITDVRARFLSASLVGAAPGCILSPFAGAGTQKARVFVVGASDEIHAIVDVFATKA